MKKLKTVTEFLLALAALITAIVKIISLLR